MTVVSNRIDHPERLAALHQTALVGSPADAAFDRLTRLATRVIGAPIALVTLIDADHQFFKSCIGLPEPWASLRQTPLSHAFCQYPVMRGEPLILEDARDDPTFRENLGIPDLGIVAYAGIPLITSDGHALGAFCVIDQQPRQWTAEEIDVLRDLAAAVMTEIELRTAIAMGEARARVHQATERALRESEAWLDLAVEGANVGVWDLNLDSGAITCSTEGRTMFGVPDEIATTYDLLMSLMHEEDRERVVTMADAAFRAQALYGTEFRIIWPDGTVRWIAATGRGVYDDEGNAIRLAGVVIDVTDQRLAEDQQRFFVEAAAHDLKGPLTTIKGQSQLMRRRLQRHATDDIPNLTRGLDAIDGATDKASLLINELLDAAHLRAGRALDLDRRPVDLAGIARAVATDLARTTTNHAIHIEAGSDRLMILGDAIRIERVVGNLMTNAIKYSPAGGEILVTVARDDSDTPPWATLTVKDQGVGIPTGDLPHIFERFRRGSNVGVIGGAGVGLAGVRQIIEQHDGTVAVESEEGQGSIFTIRVPRAVARV